MSEKTIKLLERENEELKKENDKLRHFAEVVKALSYLGNDKNLERLALRVLQGE